MGFQEASPLTVSTTVGNIVAAAGDLIIVSVLETSAATPSGTGLPAFTAQTLTAGTSSNAGDSARSTVYRTVCGISFNDTLAFANNALGYIVYVYSGLVTTGTNGSDAIVQAVGHFDSTQDNPTTITYSTPIGASNIGVAAWHGFQNIGTVLPTTPKSGWATDGEVWDAGTTWLAIAQSRTGADTTATVTFGGNVTQSTFAIGLELQVAGGGPTGNPWYYYSQQ